MPDVTLTKTRLTGGVWEGRLSGLKQDAKPALQASHDGVALDGLTCDWDVGAENWVVRLPLPATVIADGLQTVVIGTDGGAETLASIALFNDDIATDEVLSEIGLLRAELDMLKRAFRRHCLETT